MKNFYYGVKVKISHFLILAFFVTVQTIFAQTGKVTGDIVDINTGDGLPGANILIEGTVLGAAADIDGNYLIYNIPEGKYNMVVTYLGYNEKTVEVNIVNNKTIEIDIELEPKVLVGEEVLVTAQAQGQMQAINQQLSSKNIKNVVSRKQIQDLPEANAAEAVGRLPGVSLERSGGEGNKLVIRGMSSKYSLVQIDGVNMAATGSDNRSTDLSMISPYMLEGIELTKSIMANQEATATGGIVNFKIKRAPDVPTLTVIAQGGMNSLRDTYKDYKVSLGGSHRFFSNRLGIYAQADFERKDAGSEQLGATDMRQESTTAPVRTYAMQLMDIYRDVQRTGGALVFDYSFPSTTIKSSNFYSKIKREETIYRNEYDFNENDFSISFDDTPESWLTILTNSLQIEHRSGNFEIASTLSHSYSENENPLNIYSSNAGTIPDVPFGTDRTADFNVDINPEIVPDLFLYTMDETVRNMNLNQVEVDRYDIKERDLTADLNLSYTLNITDNINMKLSLGAKIKHKTKDYDRTETGYANQGLMKLAHDNFEISQRSSDYYDLDPRQLYLEDFLVDRTDSFLGGRYNFSPMFDKDKFRRLYDLASASEAETVFSIYTMLQPDFANTNYEDYNGKEDYHAFYIMPEINIGPQLLIVPGARYEANRTEYTGYRGNRLGVLRDFEETPIDTVTKVRNNNFLLPMVQVFYKATDWLTIKAGYTHTLLRPDYNQIMPGWLIGTQGSISNLRNFHLSPELSRNWDLQFSFHSNEIGLLSVSTFHKTITNMIFYTGQKAILDPSYYELPESFTHKLANTAVNNENPAYNYGFELEWQSNFWFLPGLLKGIVVNVNYTYNKSEAKYLRTRVKVEVDPVTYKTRYVNQDTTYDSPMLQQPKHLLNLTIGYDYKGFSIRWAMRYKSNIFKNANWYEELRGYSTDFYRFDVQVRQALPFEGIEFFLNVNNISGEKENDVINHKNFSSYIEDYGRSANLGLRYQL